MNVRLTLFCLLVFLYAFFSTPFPVTFSSIEAIIALISFILFLFSLPSLRAASIPIKKLFFKVFLYVTFLFLVGLYGFVFTSLSLQDFIRDTASLLFILLIIPLSLLHNSAGFRGSVSSYEKSVRSLSECLCLSGLALSVRALFADQVYGNNNFLDIGKEFFLGDLTYKQYDPLVIFSAIYSIQALFLGLCLPRPSRSLKTIFVDIASISYRLLTIVAVSLSYIAILQRFPMILVLMISLFMLFKYLSIGSRRLQIFFIIGMICLFAISIAFLETLSTNIDAYYASLSILLSAKADAQGGLSISYKIFETNQVFASFNLSESVFGLGLGSLYYNPEIQGFLRFTHSLLNYIPLKFGIAGCLLTLIFIFTLRQSILSSVNVLRKCLISHVLPSWTDLLVSSSFAPIILAFLQPSYKVFSFPIFLGIILAF